MKRGENRQVVFSNENPRTASHRDADLIMGVTCKRVCEFTEQVRWYIQSRLSETETSVTCNHLYFVQRLGGGGLILGGVLGRDEMCLLTEAKCKQDEAMFAADSSWSTFIYVAAFRVLGAIAHLLEILYSDNVHQLLFFFFNIFFFPFVL